jgi:hypothetical protein
MPDTPTEKPSDLLVTDPPAAPLATVQPTIEMLLGAALAAGRSAAEVKELRELHRDMKADRALEAFNRAFVQFKKECPPIPRTRKTDQYTRVTADGRRVQGDFADLETIAKVVNPVLLRHGLSYRWTDTKLIDGLMVVTCRLAHEDGHSEDSPSPPFPVGKPIVSKAGNQVQSVQQVSASTSTYARRYSLISALGLTTVDEDDDGLGENGEPAGSITEEQAKTIQDLIIQSEADRVRFLKLFGVQQVSEIPGNRFEEACGKLNQKIVANRSKA